MKKTLLQFTFIFALFALIGAGCVFGGGGNSKNQTPDLEQSKPIVIDTKQYSTDSYKSKYGYELTYPTYYKEDNNYSIWTAENEAVHLLDEWGVIEGSASIFVVSVYPKDYKIDFLKKFGLQESDKKVVIAGKKGNKIEMTDEYGQSYDDILLEDENYIFLIHSAFANQTGVSSYEQYKNILASLQFGENKQSDETTDSAWVTYRNKLYGFSLMQPKDWKITFTSQERCWSWSSPSSLQENENWIQKKYPNDLVGQYSRRAYPIVFDFGLCSLGEKNEDISLYEWYVKHYINNSSVKNSFQKGDIVDLMFNGVKAVKYAPEGSKPGKVSFPIIFPVGKQNILSLNTVEGGDPTLFDIIKTISPIN